MSTATDVERARPQPDHTAAPWDVREEILRENNLFRAFWILYLFYELVFRIDQRVFLDPGIIGDALLHFGNSIFDELVTVVGKFTLGIMMERRFAANSPESRTFRR